MFLRPRRLLVTSVASVTVALGFVVAGSGSLASGASTAVGEVGDQLVSHPLLSLDTPSVRAGAPVQSANWAGYDEGLLDTDKLATSISAEWTIPTATQANGGQAESSATWVGIGGGCVDMSSGCLLTDETLIQAGTEQDVDSSGKASYSAWWELLPLPSETASIAVNPGDRVSVSITGPVLWTITFKDITDKQHFTETIPYTSTMDSAEWIEEAPVVISASGENSSPVSAGEAALPDLTSPDFDDATLDGQNPGFTSTYEMEMVNSNGEVLAAPSGPNPGRDGFNVCTYPKSLSSCPAPSS